jgi:hypothetical protein
MTAEANFLVTLAGRCPASPAFHDEAKGHNIKANYLTGKPRPLGGSFTLVQGLIGNWASFVSCGLKKIL